MKLFSAIALFTLAVCPVVANQYFGLDAGTNHCELTNVSSEGPKIGLKLGARYGYSFDSGIRAEFHVVHRCNNNKTDYVSSFDDVTQKVHSSVHSWSYMVNALYDVTQLTTKSITPYFGAGIGYCQNTAKHKVQFDGYTTGAKYKDNRFAYQGILGAKYAINDQLSTGLEYHYFCGKAHAKEHSFGVVLVRNF